MAAPSTPSLGVFPGFYSLIAQARYSGQRWSRADFKSQAVMSAHYSLVLLTCLPPLSVMFSHVWKTISLPFNKSSPSNFSKWPASFVFPFITILLCVTWSAPSIMSDLALLAGICKIDMESSLGKEVHLTCCLSSIKYTSRAVSVINRHWSNAGESTPSGYCRFPDSSPASPEGVIRGCVRCDRWLAGSGTATTLGKLLCRGWAVKLSHGYKEDVEFPLLHHCVTGPRSLVAVLYYFAASD